MSDKSNQKVVQYFTDEYLASVRGATSEQIIAYLENFRALQSALLSQEQPSRLRTLSQSEQNLKLRRQAGTTQAGPVTQPSKLISLKVPHQLLNQFKLKAQSRSIAYQTQIKVLMAAWVKSSKS
jgi:predicted DNA binding CopG/RHH family protein